MGDYFECKHCHSLIRPILKDHHSMCLLDIMVTAIEMHSEDCPVTKGWRNLVGVS